MTLDPGLIKDFISEIQQLEKELKEVVMKLDQKIDQPELFAKFSQVIDRIYGTAATFGMKEFAEYCGMLKKINADCSKSSNKRGQQRVLSLQKACLERVDSLIKGIQDPDQMKKMQHSLHLEIQKAKKIQEEIFQFDKK